MQEKMKITEENKDNIIDNYATMLIDGMDFHSLWEFARDGIVKNLKDYSIEQLETEIKEFYPEILEN